MLRKVLLLIIGLIVFRGLLYSIGALSTEPIPEAETTAVDSKPLQTKTPPAKNIKKWTIQEHTDKLSGEKIKLARLVSDNSLSLAFPYNGLNFGELVVRSHPQYGLDVYVRVDKGQIICRQYNKCVHRIRFDDKEVEDFTVNQAADNSSDIVFAAYPKWALGNIKKAKKIYIQLLMYNEGEQLLTFTVDEPLSWD